MTATSANTLSRDLALRIGLAARLLPDATPRQVLDALIDQLALPLTEKKLGQLTVKQLKTGLSATEAADQLANLAVPRYQEAVRCLWGEIDTGSDLPEPVPYTDGDMPDSIRVAVASNEGEEADGHFGSCPRFLIYQLSTREVRLIGLRPTLGAEKSEDRNAYRANLINDCQILVVGSIGGPAAAKVIRAGVFPIKLKGEQQTARAVIARLQGVLAGSPPPWLAKIMGRSPEERVCFPINMEEDTA